MEHTMSSMKMYFHFGFGDEFLFKNLVIDSTLKLWTVCGVLFVLTVLFEFIKYARCVTCGCQPRRYQRQSDGGDQQGTADTNCYVAHLRSNRHKLLQTILHVIQTVLGFVIMLSIMSFNLCIIFAITTGTAVGFFVFYRSYNEIEAIDSCH